MPDKPQYGPDNPHPLSTMKTELVWEGKYDEYGNRRPIKLPTTPLPLQHIETIDEPLDREKATQRSMFDLEGFVQKAHRDDFRNMLIWGDNKLAMASLLEKFRGKVDLIYIDPPFDVGADFTMQVQLGDEDEILQKEQSILEAVAYRDTWGKGTDSYLHMIYERLILIRDLLSEQGSIYVHCDWHIGHFLKLLLDHVFSQEGFINEIIWKKLTTPKVQTLGFGNVHDSIFLYRKTYEMSFNQLRKEHREDYLNSMYRYVESDTGRRYRLHDFTQKGAGSSKKFGDKVLPPPSGKHWIWSQERIDEGIKKGIIVFSKTGLPQVKRYLDEVKGHVIDDIWSDVDPIGAVSHERTGYNTQKPEELLDRIIQASSNEGDLVADFFCGSGTTLAVAEKLGRRWIGVDLGRYAIHTTRKRLIQVQRELHEKGQPYRSFDVFNLGRYERQWWQMERLKGADMEHRRIVLQFYKAAPLDQPPNPLLHGKKAGAFVHVDKIDSIFTYDELKSAALAAQSAGARELHCLAWEFEMELALKKQAIEAETGLIIRLKYIPREIMEPNRTECQFFEAGYLEAEAINTKGKIDIKLVKFAPALAEAPEKEMQALRERAVKSPLDFIDFWAVDFEHRNGKPFEHHWQDFRTRKDRSLKTVTDIGWKYESSGTKQICVKVIDVFGVDTTTVVVVEA